MIGERIRQARGASGLSLRGLAEKAGVSAMAISKYETGKSTPTSHVLLSLARALEVRVEYFFRPSRVTLRDVEYRKHAKLPQKLLHQIKGDVVEQLERYFELELFLPGRPIKPFRLPPGLPNTVNEYAEIERVADIVRKAWQLGTNPIPDLTDALEERGLKIIQSNALHGAKFDGLAAIVDGTPVIVVGSEWPGDRQRFTLAHELGHLILKNRLGVQLDEEKAANRFAGAFLVPAFEVRKELGERRTWLEPKELCVLKKAYGASMGAWKHRALDLGILSETNYIKMVRYFRQRNWHKLEPCDEYPRERPQLFVQLVFHALAENLISESKAAELMGKSLVEFRDIRNVEHAAKIVSQ